MAGSQVYNGGCPIIFYKKNVCATGCAEIISAHPVFLCHIISVKLLAYVSYKDGYNYQII